MQRLAGPAFAAFVALLAVTAVGAALGEFGPVADLTVSLMGLALLAGGLLSLVEAGQRLHQLARFALADVRDGRDVAALSSGSHWLRIEDTVAARGETAHGVLDDTPAVAVTAEGDVRERFAGLPWPSTRTGTRFERTDAVPAALGRSAADVTVTVAAAGAPRSVGRDVRVVGGERERLTVDDDVPTHTRRALADLGVDVERDVFRGRAFEHYVRVTEATVPDGETFRLFGPVTVETDGRETTLAPAGRFASRPLLTTAGWRAILRRVGRRLCVLSLLTLLFGAAGLFLLRVAVPSLLG